jgi:hypothetical protein
VRIRVPQDVAGGNVLRPGLSVVVSVNTKPGTEVAAGSLGTPAGKPARTALVR